MKKRIKLSFSTKPSYLECDKIWFLITEEKVILDLVESIKKYYKKHYEINLEMEGFQLMNNELIEILRDGDLVE